MFYGGVAWSEVPISTSKAQEGNGEQFDYDFIIDQILDTPVVTDSVLLVGFSVQQSINLELSINSLTTHNMELQKVKNV